MNETTKILGNGVEVLARVEHDGYTSATKYANWTQAHKKAEQMGAPWRVYHWTRPFYVGLPIEGAK